ncbi:hypothetical protein UFOVP671_59 [uncultured Caudovirales phage]|uniref:Uncharacterized protein n=1 Tax=uncultured Caudovirales phage TaxID=2100421 RepID=A0A6J5NFT8_9CAUD|nr:hypothetical protein UFOVP671_59 [uncultured Caudovirales phage]
MNNNQYSSELYDPNSFLNSPVAFSGISATPSYAPSATPPNELTSSPQMQDDTNQKLRMAELLRNGGANGNTQYASGWAIPNSGFGGISDFLGNFSKDKQSNFTPHMNTSNEVQLTAPSKMSGLVNSLSGGIGSIFGSIGSLFGG